MWDNKCYKYGNPATSLIFTLTQSSNAEKKDCRCENHKF